MKFVAHFRNYPEKRNVLDLHGDLCQFRSWNLTRLVHKFARSLRFQSYFLNQLYFHTGRSRVLHTFNGINILRGPFIMTFESDIPRMWMKFKPWQLKLCLKILASNNCRQLIAISERSLKLQSDRLQTFQRRGLIDAKSVQQITWKTTLIKPPQRIINPGFKERDGAMRIIFVGNLFFLKGGRELFYACENVIRSGHQIELTIISSLESDEWCSGTNRSDTLAWSNLLSNTDWIRWLSGVSNEKVMHELQQHHLASLPTKRDSYGYFVLEAQACGVPVISSDYGVMPEINHVGWIVEKTAPDDELDEGMTQGIADAIIEAFDEEIRAQKSRNSWTRIADEHDCQLLQASIVVAEEG